MKRLSSKTTFIPKKIFPIMWFGFLTIFLGIGLLELGNPKGPGIMFIVMPLAMGIFGYFFMKKTLWDLIDEVYDEGTTLFFRNGGKEARINLKDIKNVSY